MTEDYGAMPVDGSDLPRFMGAEVFAGSPDPTKPDLEVEAAIAKVRAVHPQAGAHLSSGSVDIYTGGREDRLLASAMSFKGAWLMAAKAVEAQLRPALDSFAPLDPYRGVEQALLGHAGGLMGTQALEAEMNDRLSAKDRAIALAQAERDEAKAAEANAWEQHADVQSSLAAADEHLREADERAEKAERERDQARSEAIWAVEWFPSFWVALAPGDRILTNDGAWAHRDFVRDVRKDAARFAFRQEAMSAGRAVPWWTQAASTAKEGAPHG